MKTINYKNANVMKTLVAVVIIMTSFSGIARGVNSNQDSIGTMGNESAVEVQSWMNGVEYNAADFVAAEMTIVSISNSTETISNTFEAELALQVKYNAADFVAAEMVIETESMNETISDTFEAELVMQVKYNAAEYIATELAIETESRMNETINDTFEAELALQVKYNAAEYVATEFEIETESRMNHNTCLNVSEFHINCGYVLASK